MGKYSTGLGIRDVANNLSHFERENGCVVSIRMSLIKRNGSNDLELTAVADLVDAENSDQKCLAYANATCSAMNVQSLEAALIHLLYRLDGRLVANELRGPAQIS
jgi:hypothetical protein